MATYTQYKNLEKPLSTEQYSVAVTNKNNDVIDSELHKLELKNQSQDELLATKEALNEAIEQNETIVETLETAIGNKADTLFYDENTHKFQLKSGDRIISSIVLNLAPPKELIKIESIPSFNNQLIYNGSEQIAQFTDYNEEQLYVSGNIGVNAGQYIAVFTPKSDFCWSDGTTSSKNVSWHIEKADSNFILSQDAVVLYNECTSADITLSNIVGNNISLTLDNANIITANIVDNIIHIISNGSTGKSIISVTVAESDNYKGISKNVTVIYAPCKIVTWADGTDEEIVDMVDASKNGDIDLTDFWNVGDKRTMSLNKIMMGRISTNTDYTPEQSVTLVLLHKGLYKLVEPVKDIYGNNRLEASFVVGLENNINIETTTIVNGAIHTNIGGAISKKAWSYEINGAIDWKFTDMYSWCNNQFYEAIPMTLKPIFAKFIALTSNSDGTLTTSENYFTLLAEKEVTGSCDHGFSIEANSLTQFEYYTDESKRIHRNHKNQSRNWWLRSQHPSGYNFWMTITDTGECKWSTPINGESCISPFGCIY